MLTRFRSDTARNDAVHAILSRWHRLALPQSWLVAGCLFQTVWNIQSGRPPGAGIRDYDIFYFDSGDLSPAAETQVQSYVDSMLGDLGVEVEVANQARVHAWYAEHFGRPYPALRSVEEGIDRFLVLETCVGIRPDELYAPNGLEGVYEGTLTPNSLAPFPELFDRKVESYRRRWDWLSVRTSPQDDVTWRPVAAGRYRCSGGAPPARLDQQQGRSPMSTRQDVSSRGPRGP